METLKYAYKPKIMTMMLGVIFFGACSAVLYNEAATNDRGVIIDHIITLDTGQATLFFWCLFGASVVMTLGALLGVVKGMTSTHTLIMDDSTIRFPKSPLSDTLVTVPFRDITDMTMVQMRNQRWLRITYSGKKVNLNRSMLPNNAVFDKVCNALAERVESARRVSELEIEQRRITALGGDIDR